MKSKWLQMLAVAGIASIALAGAASALPFTIYSTGFTTGSTSVQQANEGVDGNYTIVEAAGVSTLTSAYVTNKVGYPIVSGPWLPDSALSQWISPLPSYNGGQASPAGVYSYQTDLTLSGLSASTSFVLDGLWATDNYFDGIYVNGHLIPGTIGPANVNEFKTFTAFTDSAYLINGVNTLDFDIINATGATNNPTGLNTRLTGYYLTTPEPSTVVPIVFGVVGISLLMFRRKRIS
jgi:hypothetical protein